MSERIPEHNWLYHHVIDGRQIVQCRRCHKWDSYRLTGYKPQPPFTECKPLAEQSQGKP